MPDEGVTAYDDLVLGRVETPNDALEDVVAKTPGVTLAKLDVDANPQTSTRFGIRGIPAVKAFRDGAVADEFVGLQPRQNVEQFVAHLVPAAVEALPDDEAGLRGILERQPDRRDARRALGRRLIAAGRFDDADAILAAASDDPVSDGLRARIEMQRADDGVLPPGLNKRHPAEELNAMPDLIAAIATTDKEERSRLRRVALGVLAEHGGGDPAVEALRSQLASALF